MSKIKKIFSNNLYALKMLHKINPFRIWFTLLMTVWGCIIDLLANIILIRSVINEVQAGKNFFELFIFVIGIFLFQFITGLSISLFDNFYLPRTDIEINRKFQKIFFDKVFEMDLACFENAEFFDKYVRASSIMTTKINEVLQTVCSLISTVFMTFSITFILFSIDKFLILFSLVPFFYQLIFSGKFNKIKYQNRLDNIAPSRQADYANRIFYLIDYVKEMRLTKISVKMLDLFHDAMKKQRNIIKKYFPKLGLIAGCNGLVNTIIVDWGATLYLAYKAIVSRSVLLGDFYIGRNSVKSISQYLWDFAGIYQHFGENALYIDDLRFFLEYTPQIKPNLNGPKAPLQNLNLSLKDVCFKYESQTQFCLKHINIDIAAGEKIAIVGHNGAGKSTLVKLIMRLYDVTEGVITVNNINIREYNLESYRQIFGTIFQDFQVFGFSFGENILVKEIDSSEDEEIILDACKKSGIIQKINTLNKGIHTVLSREFDEEGTILSGGEYQKVALARVFAKPCGIVILDEPSSALDPIAEYEMYNNMMKACEGKTVIFISHRLSSAVLADKVVYLEHGKICEMGTHKELLQKNGAYADLFHKQAEKYIGD